MTKAKLIKSNERKNVVIFIMLAIVFVLSITVPVQSNKLNKTINDLTSFTEKLSLESFDIWRNTNEILSILNLGDKNGN